MTQTRNKNNTKKYPTNSARDEKKLPNFFTDTKDEVGLLEGLCGSVIIHAVFSFLLILLVQFSGLIFTNLPKPPMPQRDIEFKLVQAPEKPPIDKNTKIRSDRDSQAGGKHDPTRPVSEPAPAPAKPQPKAQAQPKAPSIQEKIKQAVVQPKPQVQPQQPQLKPKLQPKVQPQVQPQVQQQVKPQPQPVVAQQPKKPTPVAAPALKPTVKPTVQQTGVAKPTAPKIAAAPKSPFQVGVPAPKAPVGSTYRPQGVPSGGSSGGTSGGSSGSSAPAPKFSGGGAGSKGGTGSTGSTGSLASRGTGGYGSGGNPSPGNPNGTPGIDAIKQPNWGPYMRDLEQRIKRNWSPPKGDSSKRVVITFTIGRDGRLLSHHITKSSGVPLADRAAMSAIELTAPFRPLPPEFKGQSVPIEFTFDYNVLNSVLR